MAYNIRWDPHKPKECKEAAEKHALYPGIVWGNGFLYRLEDVTYATRIDPYEDWDDNWTSTTYVELIAYAIKNKTPQGHTLYEMTGARNRWVSNSTTKRFALPTVEEALESYIARKRRQAQIYRARADKAERCIAMASPDTP